MLIGRGIQARYQQTVEARRVTVVTGARQSGKTTLVRTYTPGTPVVRTLDDDGVLAAALADPSGFVLSGDRTLVIDEVQRGGDALVRAIKMAVDRRDSPGQFVLTGSSNFLTVPTLSESLAGRAGFVEVAPFTQGELAGAPERFVDALFDAPDTLRDFRSVGAGRLDLLERVCTGGYPEVHRLPMRSRPAWFRDYVATTIERDVVQLSGIRKVDELRQLLRLLAARTGGELVMQNLIDDSALERQAVYDHRAWLESIHLVATVPAWSRNLSTRVKRRPKIFLTDPGLAAWLLGKTPAALQEPTDPATGPLVETFAVAELRRQLAWSETEPTMFHWRDRAGGEVDVVLEAPDGRVVGLEVKAGLTAKADWFRWLTKMREVVGDRFVIGVALYGGDQVLSFGDRLLAVPLSALWELS